MAKNTVGFKAQDSIISECKPLPFSFDYELHDGTVVAIEVNPALTMQHKKDFVDLISSMCLGEQFVPSNFSTAIRIAALYTYTNLKIDLEKIDRTYALADYSYLYSELSAVLEKNGYGQTLRELEAAAREYVDWRKQEVIAMNAAMVAGAQKHAIDSLLEDLLIKLHSVLDKFADENGDINAKDVLGAITTMGKLQDEGTLVDNVINFRFGKGAADEHREESAGVSNENGGGEKED